MANFSINDMEAALTEKRKEALFISFEQEGSRVIGVLKSVARGEITDRTTKKKKEIVRYTIEQPDGAGPISFIGTAQINEMLSPADKGKVVSVKFIGKRETANGAMKLFEVVTSAGPVAGAAESFDAITDDDIPF